ncbi:hypothetical protein DBR18_10590, partial [Pseudomonas sp. HMWF021]
KKKARFRAKYLHAHLLVDAVTAWAGERIQGVRASASALSQRLTSPKNHIGSEEVNIFKALCDTLELLHLMNVQVAQHAHSQIGQPPINSAAFLENSNTAKKMHALTEDVTLN